MLLRIHGNMAWGGFFVRLGFTKQDLKLFLMLLQLRKYVIFYPLSWVNDHYYGTKTMPLKTVYKK